MKTSTVLLGGSIAFLLYSYTRKSIAAGNLYFFPDKIESFNFDGLTPVMVAGLRVQNTSNQSFTLYSFAANVYCNEYLIGNAYSFQPQQVLPNAQGLIYFSLRLMPLGIVNELIRAFQDRNFAFDVIVKGSMNVDNLQVPIELKYKVGL